MELKPEKNNVKPKYPNEDGIKNEELNKPLKKWKKVGITAAVLGSLGIIGVVCSIVNKGDDLPQGAIMEYDDDIIQFNSQFEAYQTAKQKGSNVKTLIEKVRVNNLTNIDSGDRIVTISTKLKEAKELSEYKTSILSGKFYEVEIEYNEMGLVKNINITELETVPVVNEVKEENKISFKKITKEDFIKKIEGIIKWANHNGLA